MFGLHSSNMITSFIQHLHDAFGFTPVIATEIEFYLIGASHIDDLDCMLDALKQRCLEESIAFTKIEAERGQEQYEIALPPERDSALIIQKTVRLKQLIAEIGAAYGVEASFAAKPFATQPGSGLHMHVHLENAEKENVYFKQDEIMSDALRFSLGGLLATMQESMPVFAPHSESLARYVAGSNAPTTISWGANNRTTALRLPDKLSHIKHIEHRVAGADADPEAVIAAILAGIVRGLDERIDPGSQIYGDASLAMYGLPKLVNNI